MRHLTLLLFALFAGLLPGRAQPYLEVQVTDSHTGAPLAFAHLYLKADGSGAATGLEGTGRIGLKRRGMRKDTLQVSYIGYRDTALEVSLKASAPVKVSLQPEPVMLDMATVSGAASSLTARQIIRKAVRSIRKNYSRDAVYLDVFYRESFLEDDSWAEVNEAAARIYYTRYPQKGYARRSFRRYYKEDYSGKAANRPDTRPLMLTNAQYFKYYNTSQDQCKIIGARLSENLSDKGVSPLVQGGPLGLTAADKMKYLADFFDPKLMDGYHYAKNGAALIDGRPCFVISVKPTEGVKGIHQPWNKKVRYPIFAGTAFIDMESFAVVSFQCQLSSEVDFGGYQKHHAWQYFPDISTVRVDYQESGGLWFLKRIATRQLVRRHTHGALWMEHDYTLERELWVQKVETEGAAPFDDDDPALFKDQQNAMLARFPDHYDAPFWDSLEQSGRYPPLPAEARRQLEAKTPLARQWNRWFRQEALPPPRAPEKADSIALGNGRFLPDGYRWMENYADSLTQSYINAENAFFYNALVPFKKEQFLAYREVVNTLAWCDTLNDNSGKPIVTRGFGPEGNPGWIEEHGDGTFLRMIIDLEKDIRAGQRLRKIYLSPDRERVAFLAACPGEGRTVCYLKDLDSQVVTDSLPARMQEFHWMNDSLLVYTVEDHTRRAFRLYSYAVSEKSQSMLLETPTRRFELEFAELPGSPKALLLNCTGIEGNRLYRILAEGPRPALQLLHDEAYYSYSFQESPEHVFVLARREDNRSVLLKISKEDVSKRETLIVSEPEVVLDELLLTKNHLLVKVIDQAVVRLFKYSRGGEWLGEVKMPEEHCAIHLDKTIDPEGDTCVLEYSSPNTPPGTCRINLSNDELAFQPGYCLEKEPGQKYRSQLHFVTAEDGRQIPLRLTYREGLKGLSQVKGILLIVYGAYGAFNEARFDEYHRLLMDEEYIIGLAAVRGSRAMGWEWYRQGRGVHKRNAVSDYLACAGYVAKELGIKNTIAYGQSAGGTIVGAALNERPALFRGAILDYPFLDVPGAMLNDSLPLTTLEYPEWGNPAEPEEQERMLRYSPYQNISGQAYPPILLLGGKFDYQAPYWNVLKAAARYRKYGGPQARVLAHINSTYHPGKIPYRERMKEMVYQYLFMQDCLR